MPDKIVENTNFGKAKEKRDGFSLFALLDIFSPLCEGEEGKKERGERKRTP
ncbi:hypothetical protein BofuT4_P016560.1 [Botrytis cinerea T4]|uniref:Uncharacterized protein n=1 Tax=Botryotinia fuckeliana (strain T4) TaxID=999810 RepID=G2YI13_BOTF4|nr:hypothetical protein BofuT4_P016560.1 [Botrytis cinerea T4]